MKRQKARRDPISSDPISSLAFNKNHPALKHLDYGYVLTNYKVQGKDAARGVGLMESHHRFSATLKNFYVQISRGVFGMTLVTDDRERLVESIERNSDEKKASLDMISSQQLIAHEARFKDQSQLSIQPTIDKKIKRELVSHADTASSQFLKEKMVQDLSFSKHNQNAINKLEKVRELER